MSTILSENDLSKEAYSQLKVLSEEHILQVLNFIKYLKLEDMRGSKTNPLIEFIMAEADPEITLDDVREQLGGIKGNLSDTVAHVREERT